MTKVEILESVSPDNGSEKAISLFIWETDNSHFVTISYLRRENAEWTIVPRTIHLSPENAERLGTIIRGRRKDVIPEDQIVYEIEALVMYTC